MTNPIPVQGLSEDAWTRIARERQRQIAVEGWTPAHDDEHSDGAILRAAVIYIWHGTEKAGSTVADTPDGWPWDKQWWKPKDRARNLERAGALCLAEHDRLVRCGRPTGPADHKLGVAIRELSAALVTELMRSAASSLDYSFQQNQRFMDDWLQRFEAAIEKLPTPIQGDGK